MRRRPPRCGAAVRSGSVALPRSARLGRPEGSEPFEEASRLAVIRDVVHEPDRHIGHADGGAGRCPLATERKGAVEGKRGGVRVIIGGRPYIEKKDEIKRS